MAGTVRWLGALLALAGATAFAYGSPAFSLDDAYIHLAYAKSLWLGDGLSYNPHDWELGASSPLWAILLAPLSTLTQVQLAVQALGALLHAAGAYATGQLAEQLGARANAAALASIAFALHPLLLQGATSGMEVSLTALLLILLTLEALREHPRAASALGFAAVLARPETLVFAGVLALGSAWQKRRAQPLWIALGPGLAMASWCLYCELISGYPLPNTFYAKAGFEPLSSLKFLTLRVFGEEPWLIGLGGAWLICTRVRERGMARVCGLAYLVTLFAIAGGRLLIWKLLFVQQRYFAYLAFMPCALAAAAVAETRARSSYWFVPVLLASVLSLPRALTRTHAQEWNTRVLHVDVASFVSAQLPRDVTIGVEGAGAHRFYAARTRTVVDVLGLNDRRIVHAGSQLGIVCMSATRLPAYLILPDGLLPAFGSLFAAVPVRRFRVEQSAHTVEPFPWTVHVLKVVGLREELVARCRQLQ